MANLDDMLIVGSAQEAVMSKKDEAEIDLCDERFGTIVEVTWCGIQLVEDGDSEQKHWRMGLQKY